MTTKWEEKVRYALSHKHEIERKKEVAKKKAFYKKLRRNVSIPIIIGIFAAALLVHNFGWDALYQNLLNWIIGLTLVATIIAYLPKQFKH
jgi:pheromone shutdown protein TraB